MKTKFMKKIEKRINNEYFIKDIDTFLHLKEKYINNPSIENSVNMKMAYEVVFASLKDFQSRRLITQEEFWMFVSELKEGF